MPYPTYNKTTADQQYRDMRQLLKEYQYLHEWYQQGFSTGYDCEKWEARSRELNERARVLLTATEVK